MRNWYELTRDRQAARLIAEMERGLAPDKLLLKRDDLLGPREITTESSKVTDD